MVLITFIDICIHTSILFDCLGHALTPIFSLSIVQHAKYDEIRADWKLMETKDLVEIEKLHDKANRALTDARYWRSHSNPSVRVGFFFPHFEILYLRKDMMIYLQKMQDSESKYKQFSVELVEMIERLREKKEQLFPDYIRRMAEAQVEFYRSGLDAAQKLMNALDSVGPVYPNPVQSLVMDFDIAQNMEEDPNTPAGKSAVKNPYGLSQAPAAAAGAGAAPVAAPPRPAAAQKQARGIYQFQATNHDELSFNPGDILTVHEQSGDWWTAELNGRRGFVPANYLQPL